MGKTRMKLYADTGSRYTIITPAQYRKTMGKVVAAETRLGAWGSKTYLDVKGMFLTNLTMDKGASTEARVYMVDGYRPEALLVSDLRAGGIKVDTVGRLGHRPPLRHTIALLN